jgi:hypothetical protein
VNGQNPVLKLGFDFARIVRLRKSDRASEGTSAAPIKVDVQVLPLHAWYFGLDNVRVIICGEIDPSGLPI